MRRSSIALHSGPWKPVTCDATRVSSQPLVNKIPQRKSSLGLRFLTVCLQNLIFFYWMVTFDLEGYGFFVNNEAIKPYNCQYQSRSLTEQIIEA